MNARQRRFCEAYAACANATQAALEAGYSERSARFVGSRLLTNVDIAEYISELQEEIRSEEIASIHEVKRFWSAVMRDDTQKVADRLSASKFLAQTSGAFLDANIMITNNGVEKEDVVIYLPEIDRIEGCEQREGDS